MAETEAEAIAQVDAALTGLDQSAALRVLRWANDKYGSPGSVVRPRPSDADDSKARAVGGFDDIADLVAAADPGSGYERALVVTYWFQEIQGEADVTGQQVNAELNNLGHRSSNITEVFTNLMNRKPALATQTRKSGKSRQARKRYKLTRAGITEVNRLLAGPGD